MSAIGIAPFRRFGERRATSAAAVGRGWQDGDIERLAAGFARMCRGRGAGQATEEVAAIQALEARLEDGGQGVVLGDLAAGDGGFNQPWSWHLVPGTIEAPAAATEVCDGTPALVVENLDYWLNTVERFCPWSTVVAERLD